MRFFKKTNRIVQITKITLVLVLVFGLSGCDLFKKKEEGYGVSLEIWGIVDDTDAYRDIINQYREINPHVEKITYRKFLVDDYKNDLIDALASGNGPDIFLIHNTWLPQFEDKSVAVDPAMIPEITYRSAFPDVVASDFLTIEGIYAVPLSVDSLALYYNKDLLNSAAITTPPQTWDQLDQLIGRLTRVNERGEVLQSAIAMGTAYNINRSTDILNVLMLQNNEVMYNDRTGRVTLDRSAQQALQYYTSFADINSPRYTWNPRLHYSIDAFYEGSVAMMINYSWQYSAIERKNAKLNFGVAELPQQSATGQKINYANYWAYAVSKNKLDETSTDPLLKNQVRIFEAWQFLKFLTMPHQGQITLQNALSGNQAEFSLPFDPAKRYLEITEKPSARRDLLEEQKIDPVLGPFAVGNLSARSWYQADNIAFESIFADTINAINNGAMGYSDAISVAQQRIQSFYGR